MVLRDIERLNRNASFGEIPRSERFLVLFSPEPDLSASSSCHRWLIERISSVPLRRLRDSRLGLRGIVKKGGKGFGKSKATYKPRCHRRDNGRYAANSRHFLFLGKYFILENIRDVWIFPGRNSCDFSAMCPIDLFSLSFLNVSFPWWFRVAYRIWLPTSWNAMQFSCQCYFEFQFRIKGIRY